MENKLEIPMEEFAQINLQKDIQIAMLMKQNKELNTLLQTLIPQQKPPAVQP